MEIASIKVASVITCFDLLLGNILQAFIAGREPPIVSWAFKKLQLMAIVTISINSITLK